VKNQLKNRITMFASALLLAAWALSTIGCAGNSTAAGAGAPPPPDVEVATVEQKDIPIVREWIGTLDGMVNAAIKAQVTGYLMKQNYAKVRLFAKGSCCLRSTRGLSRPRSIKLSGNCRRPTPKWRRPRQA